MTRGLKEVVGATHTADRFLMCGVVITHMEGPEDDATAQRLTALERACRSAIGDRLRSVTVDSPEWSGTVYRRDDLCPGVDESVHQATGDEAAFADGGRTVREFDEGYVARLQHGETCVVATSDGLKMDRGEELSAAVRGLLSE